jgi:arylsulfatase
MADRPNIVVFWGDDIGISNLSCYSDGLMGYRTPNIDRVASVGARPTTASAARRGTAGTYVSITGRGVSRNLLQ